MKKLAANALYECIADNTELTPWEAKKELGFSGKVTVVKREVKVSVRYLIELPNESRTWVQAPAAIAEDANTSEEELEG